MAQLENQDTNFKNNKEIIDVNQEIFLSGRKEPILRTKNQRVEFLAENKLLLKRLSHKLIRHTDRNANTSHINTSIYHLLCNPFTFLNAYVKISKNKGALTKGVSSDQQVAIFFGKSNAEAIARKFRNHQYNWSPVRRVMIEKPGKKTKRPIDTPTQSDRIVQEALRGILESIYEPEFVEFENQNNMYASNYGFRLNKSTWQAY